MNSKSGSSKYIYRGLCMILLAVLAEASFYICWRMLVRDVVMETMVVNEYLFGMGNMGMSLLIYLVLYLSIGKLLYAFRIGVERTANIAASQALTFLVVDTLEILISMAIAGNFRFVLIFAAYYAVLFVVQTLVIGVVVIFMIRLYRKLFPPLMILEIDGEYNNELTVKVNYLIHKYKIIKKINVDAGLEAIEAELAGCDAVLINDVSAGNENRILKMCFDKDKRVYFVPKISDIIVKTSEELNLLDTPLFLCRNIGMSTFRRFVKRVMDIVFSGIALVVLSPLMLVTAIAIKLNDGGPVFFKQERCTIHNKRFMILKFRSMIVDAEKDGRPRPAGENDDRITKVGRVIRATRIDELPQLINILKGEMSIVGPRPERVENVEFYTKEIPEFTFRSKVKGGLTGYAQVYGKYNTTALDKLKLDLMYIMNYSILLDVQIIFETLKIIFRRESTEGFSEERIRDMSGEGRE